MSPGRKPTLRSVHSQVPVYQLRVELRHIKPAIWRQILVPGSIKLPKLHGVLLWAMGWDGSHLHEFVFGDTNYGQPDPDFPRIRRC
jgi:Plasmid pRiA4b ORF-3-like protein